MINKGFVDLLFILLCGAIVMLAQSVRLGSIPSQPADAGAGASRVDGEETVVMVVGSDWVALEGRRFPGVFEASGAMGGGDVGGGGGPGGWGGGGGVGGGGRGGGARRPRGRTSSNGRGVEQHH